MCNQFINEDIGNIEVVEVEDVVEDIVVVVVVEVEIQNIVEDIVVEAENIVEVETGDIAKMADFVKVGVDIEKAAMVADTTTVESVGETIIAVPEEVVDRMRMTKVVVWSGRREIVEMEIAVDVVAEDANELRMVESQRERRVEKLKQLRVVATLPPASTCDFHPCVRGVDFAPTFAFPTFSCTCHATPPPSTSILHSTTPPSPHSFAPPATTTRTLRS